MTRVMTGGPAFPNADRGYEGMDLRDWFAGQALNGSLSGEPGSHLIPERLARDCYEFADAMLAEKEKATLANREADKKEFGDDLPF
jgi:hypothetical protein